MRSRSRGRVSNLMAYERPEQPPPVTPRRRPPSVDEMPSLAIAERMRAIALGVMLKPCDDAACGTADSGFAADMPSPGFAPIVTTFDILRIPVSTSGIYPRSQSRPGAPASLLA